MNRAWLDRVKSRWVVIAGGALVAVHVGLVWGVRTGRVGTGGDDAVYIMLSHSLRAGSYREIHRFDQPLHSQYPPGYAALLTLGGEYRSSTDAATVIGAIAGAITLILLLDLARRTMAPWLAVAAVALVAVNPLIIERSSGVFAEAAFTAAMMIAIWLSIRFAESRWGAVGATAASIAATLIRSVGISVVAALFVARLFDRKPRRAIIHALVSGIALAPWFVW